MADRAIESSPQTAELALLICAVVVLWILFFLLRPVSRDLAILAAFFNLVSIGIEAVSTMYLIVVLFPLGNAEYLTAFKPEQLYASIDPHVAKQSCRVRNAQ